ncbi:MAG TPA: metal transporter [Archaeoglobus profundus]|nr:metal transporter [Archaeoglobus profundus]
MNRAWIVIGIMVLLSPLFAYAAELVNYSEPLENVAKQLGAEENTLWTGILPDYTVPGINVYVGTLIAGAIGTAIVFGVAYGIGSCLRKV